MYLYASPALVFLLCGAVPSEQQHYYDYGYEPYLAPHEQRVYDALNNIDKDFDAFLDVFAHNSQCELTFGKDPDDIVTQSGPCHDIVSHVGSDMVHYKLNWQTLTNSDPDHPDRGVLSMMYGNYGLTSNGCEDLWFGVGEMKFNKNGQVIYLDGHSTEMLDFMNCIEGNDKESLLEEIYLAPHEQDVFDAMDNIHKNTDMIEAVLAENAQCHIFSGQDPTDIAIKSGLCTDVWDNWDDMIHNKIKWEPVTNSHALFPEKGVLAFNFWHYAFSEKGCEGLFGGTSTVEFNEYGKIIDAKSYSTGLKDFMDCLEEVSVKIE